jgi:protein-S-isoprenylcysteine O-methyltransferase Ste14
VLFGAALVIAVLANWIFPVQMFPDFLRFWFGPIVLIASLVIIVPSIVVFKRAKTPFDVRRAATALVSEGPFRYSRNPGYVALISLCIGIAMIVDNVFMLVTVAIATAYLQRFVVLAEERHMEAQFGEEYLEYKRKVRRWL